MSTTRRQFLKTSASAAAVSLLGLPAILSAAPPKARVVVVGGGYGAPSPPNTSAWPIPISA